MKRILLWAVAFLPSVALAQNLHVYANGNPLPSTYYDGMCGFRSSTGTATSLTLDSSGGLPIQGSQAEDVAHVSGDRGFAMLGIADDNTPSPTTSTAGRYIVPAVSSVTGALQVSIIQAFQSSAGGGLLNLEEGTPNNADAGVVGLAKVQATPSADAADGKLGTYKLDPINRMYVNPWGASATEWFYACSSSDITDTTSTAVVSATASKYHHVTAVQCTNTSAVATRVDVIDQSTGTPTIWAGMLPAGGSDGQTFATPIVAVEVNKAINAKPATTATATRCCIYGYNSAVQ